MKRLATLLFAVAVTVCLLSVMVLPASAAPAGPYVYGGGLLSAEQSAALETAFAAASERTGVGFYFFDGGTTERTRSYIGSALSLSPTDDAVVLSVYRTDEWHYNLDTWGKADSAVTDKEVDRLLDARDVYDNLKAGRIYEGALAFLPLAERAVTGTLRPAAKKMVVWSLAWAIVAAAAGMIPVVLRYKMKMRATNYPLDKYARLQLDRADDQFLRTTVTSTVVASGSSGKSGGGGGGGGHRGGR
ncbi:MAG: hypothetical protein J6125_04345 [Clostridia bacterium]|nr:hypothetical protein [Clostridia bacterium]